MLFKNVFLKLFGIFIEDKIHIGIAPNVAISDKALNTALLAWIWISVPNGTCIPSIELSTLDN